MMKTPLAPLPIAISLGDPAGIGPEIICKVLARSDMPWLRKCEVFAPRAWFLDYAKAQGMSSAQLQQLKVQDLAVVNVDSANQTGPSPGQVCALAGEWAFRSIVAATHAVLAGKARALCTAPIHKEAMHLAGHHFPGHTELLAQLAGGVPVRMMLANDELRTVLVTIHMALRQALDAITQENVFQTICLTDKSLRLYGIGASGNPQEAQSASSPRPRIAVAGLNPHAGEAGLFGREEIEVIAPAIAQAQALGIDVQGPFAPDTVFMKARGLRTFDAVVAMYHDQGLIPVKYLGVEQGVNVTLGLPFVRTSPDHGTAFDIAGQGLADANSMQAALVLADQLSSRHGYP